MPTYARFEDLTVWQDAIRLAENCEEFILAAKDRITWSKRDQLDRASLSVSNNIAEGFERGTTNELLNFLYISRGSAGEVRSMLCFFERRPALADFRSQGRRRVVLPTVACLGRSPSEHEYPGSAPSYPSGPRQPQKKAIRNGL